MPPWLGPGTPFETLYDLDQYPARSLPPELHAIYGDWHIPAPAGRPYVYANFVMSHDGRISFNIPSAIGGGPVSGYNAHDTWLMGLLRARADAVLIGDNTVRLESEHIWTAEAIWPAEQAFSSLRVDEGRAPAPLQVIASITGDIPDDAAIFSRPDLRIVVVSTRAGATFARAKLARFDNVEYLACGDAVVNLDACIHTLYRDFSVRTLLCEGGPTLYGALLAADLVDEEFLTLSPVLIGNPRGGPQRPGLVEGVAFAPGEGPRARAVSARKAGDHLFLRSRYR